MKDRIESAIDAVVEGEQASADPRVLKARKIIVQTYRELCQEYDNIVSIFYKNGPRVFGVKFYAPQFGKPGSPRDQSKAILNAWRALPFVTDVDYRGANPTIRNYHSVVVHYDPTKVTL